jgi:hypothetical protein
MDRGTAYCLYALALSINSTDRVWPAPDIEINNKAHEPNACQTNALTLDSHSTLVATTYHTVHYRATEP